MAQLPPLLNRSCSCAPRYTRQCRESHRESHRGSHRLMWKGFVGCLQHRFLNIKQRCEVSSLSSQSNTRRLFYFNRDYSAAGKHRRTYLLGSQPNVSYVVSSPAVSEFANWAGGLTSTSTAAGISCRATESRASALDRAPRSPLVVNPAFGAALQKPDDSAGATSSADAGYVSARAARRYAVSAAIPSPADADDGVAQRDESDCVPSRARRRVCIVGAGPAGFYCAKYLLQAAARVTHTATHPLSSELEEVNGPKNKVTSLQVDMIEKLPAPYGLVRYGVAPDHPEIKRVADDFDIGKDVRLQELRSLYDAVIIAYGAAGDRQLKLEGNDRLLGCLSARSFVGYYNAHPDVAPTAEAFLPRLTDDDNLYPSVALVIGNGNVSLDVARMLTKHRKKLESTDVYGPALTWIKRANLRRVIVLGRRGWVQASFTNKELREVVTDDDLLAVVDPEEFNNSLTDASRQELSESRVKQRSAPLLEQMVKNWERRNDVDCPVIHFRFLTSPVRTSPHPEDPSRLGAVHVTRNELKGQPFHQQAVRAQQNHVEHIPCSLLIWSTGFQCIHPQTVELPTGKDGALKNNFGRVEPCSVQKGGRRCAAVFATGWARRGPHGVIASNIVDAREVAAAVLKDMEEHVGSSGSSHTNLKEDEATERSPVPNIERGGDVSTSDTITSSTTYCGVTTQKISLEEARITGSREACSGTVEYSPQNTCEKEGQHLSVHNSASEGSRLAAAAAADPYVSRTQATTGSFKKIESNCFRPACGDIVTLLRRRGVQFITFDDWMYIKSIERAKGQEKGKTATKIATAGEMLRIAKERSLGSTGDSV